MNAAWFLEQSKAIQDRDRPARKKFFKIFVATCVTPVTGVVNDAIPSRRFLGRGNPAGASPAAQPRTVDTEPPLHTRLFGDVGDLKSEV